uniref:Uncharacterized protein n=1 Tax=Romanomermis culicivorax TaxID=13658 RepID=A0A915KQA9_ROMCU
MSLQGEFWGKGERSTNCGGGGCCLCSCCKDCAGEEKDGSGCGKEAKADKGLTDDGPPPPDGCRLLDDGEKGKPANLDGGENIGEEKV